MVVERLSQFFIFIISIIAALLSDEKDDKLLLVFIAIM